MKKMVFIVDDSDTNLLTAREILHKEFSVMTIPSGEKLFKILNKLIPDLILLDIEMPGMNGFEVLEKLKSDKALSSIPVIFLTGLQSTNVEIKGMEMGAIDFIYKPFCSLSFLNRIKAHLQ